METGRRHMAKPAAAAKHTDFFSKIRRKPSVDVTGVVRLVWIRSLATAKAGSAEGPEPR
jgi:hypothetical protein